MPWSRFLIFWRLLADVPDPRRAQGKRYPLPSLLMFTVLVLLSGARSYRGIINFERNRHGRQEHRRVETFDVTGRLGPDRDGAALAVSG